MPRKKVSKDAAVFSLVWNIENLFEQSASSMYNVSDGNIWTEFPNNHTHTVGVEVLEWLILDSSGRKLRGVITVLTDHDYKHLQPIRTQNEDGWFDWKSYVRTYPQMQVYKLCRRGRKEILGVIAIKYRDGVFVDSLEIAPHSRQMPVLQKRYVNLAEILISFASVWGMLNYKDSFIGLIPKSNLQNYYRNKFGAQPYGRLYALDPVVISKLIRLYYLQGDDAYA